MMANKIINVQKNGQLSRKMDNLLEMFIQEPEREFHIREIAKLSGKSPTTISLNLKRCVKKGILKSRKFSNHVLFKANSDSLGFKTMKKEHNLNNLVNSGLIKYLEEELNSPETIILFGSYAKGEDAPASDIDLFIITPIKKELKLDRFEKILKRRIQLFLHSKKEIESMKVNNKELLNNLINGIVVYGFWEAFR